tara:strand:+ start:72 stop:887 length:816 start_codon:yes stop_codon:yes gene_type:complete
MKTILIYFKNLVTSFIRKLVKLLSILTRYKLNDYFINEYIQKLDYRESKKYNNKVAGGPFKGLIIDDSHRRKLNILLGNFESDVQAILFEKAKSGFHRTFINIGGADGFYALGLLKTGFFSNVIVYETIKKYRDNIIRNEKNNNLTGLQVFGHCDQEELNLIIKKHKNPLILCDIEGGEFELFSKDIISQLSKSTLIIEIHLFNDSDVNKYKELKNQFANTHLIREIDQRYIQTKELETLKHLKDLDILMLLNENRRIRGLWLLLEPKMGI